MAVAETEPPLIDRVLDGFDDLVLHRYPHVVGPPFVAFLALGLAEAAYALRVAALLTIVASVTFFLAIDFILGLQGLREWFYAWACWIVGCGWTIAAAWIGPFTSDVPWLSSWIGVQVPPLIAVWAVALAFAWPPWTHHRRVRRSAEVNSEILAWDGDAVGLREVDLSTAGAKADGDGWEAPLVPCTPGAWTTEKLRRAIPNIASHYGRAVHEFQIDKVRGDREGKWMLRFREARKRAPVVYQPPAERPSARKPFTIGHVTSDPTTPLQAEVWLADHGGVHSLVTGQTGYGKTTFLQRIALHAISSKDALLFLGDMKPGSPDYSVVGKHDLSPGIGPRGAYLYATSAAEIDSMILVLLALCRIRGRNLRRSRKAIVVLLDESALYFDPTEAAGPTAGDRARAYHVDMQRLAKVQALAAVARGYDIAVWMAAQKGKEKNTGGDARAALSAGQVIAFHAPKVSDGALVSSDPAFDPTKLPRGAKGQCLISNSLHPEVTRGTLWNVTEAVIRDVLDRFAGVTDDRPNGLDADELEELRNEFGEQWGELRQANRGKSQPIADEPEAEEVKAEPQATIPQSRAMTADQSRQAVWDALASFDSLAMVRDVAEAMGKDYEIVRVRLKELVADGRARQQGHGRYIKYEAVRPPLGAGAGAHARVS